MSSTNGTGTDLGTVDVATAVQDEARQAYRHSVTAGAALTGRELGRDVRPRANGGDAPGSTKSVPPMPPGTTATATSPRSRRPNPRPLMPPTTRRHSAACRRHSHGSRPGHGWSPGRRSCSASPPRSRRTSPTPNHRLGARIAAAFVPLALLLAVECMTRPRWHRRPGAWSGFWWGLARYGGTGLVALVAAVLSYRHMSALLLAYGEDALNAAIGPLAVDGLMVVAGFALLAMNNPHHTDSGTDTEWRRTDEFAHLLLG